MIYAIHVSHLAEVTLTIHSTCHFTASTLQMTIVFTLTEAITLTTKVIN
jgi:hypothetical protein